MRGDVVDENGAGRATVVTARDRAETLSTGGVPELLLMLVVDCRVGIQTGRDSGHTWSFIRFRRAPVPTLMILLANSTPMVCDERTLHSFFTKRCNMHDLFEFMYQPDVPSSILFTQSPPRLGMSRHHMPIESEDPDTPHHSRKL